MTVMNQDTRLDIFAASRRDVETRILTRLPHVLISIHDPVEPPPRLRPNELRRAVLSLVFDDAEPSDDIDNDFVLMTLDDARSIWGVIREHLPHIRTVVVHCDQGVSRSPAIAAGLLIGLDLNAADIFDTYRPNPYVLRLMLQAREMCGPRGIVIAPSP